jgi:hypothetical protein
MDIDVADASVIGVEAREPVVDEVLDDNAATPTRCLRMNFPAR